METAGPIWCLPTAVSAGGRIEPSVGLRNVAGKGFDAMEDLTNLGNFQGVSVSHVHGDGRSDIYLAGNRTCSKRTFKGGLLLRSALAQDQ